MPIPVVGGTPPPPPPPKKKGVSKKNTLPGSPFPNGPTPPPPSAALGHARYPSADLNKHTRPSRTNDQIVADSKYGQRGQGILTPSPLGSQSDRWTRTASSSRPTPTSTPTAASGGGYDYSGGYAPQGDDGGGGGGPGGPAGPTKIGWQETYKVDTAPAWWKGLTPDALDPVSEYTLLYNAMIPYMSPEDQRQAGSTLAALYPDEPLFQGYTIEKTPVASAGGSYAQSSPPRYDYLSAQRAEKMLATLDKVREVMGKAPTDYGPGYQFLRNTATILKDYGGREYGQTRGQYLSQLGALDPLIAQAKSDQLSAYGPLLQQMTQPFFSGGALREVSKDESGRYIFGRANKALY